VKFCKFVGNSYPPIPTTYTYMLFISTYTYHIYLYVDMNCFISTYTYHIYLYVDMNCQQTSKISCKKT